MRAFIALPVPPSDAEVLEAMGDRLGVGRAIPAEKRGLVRRVHRFAKIPLSGAGPDDV